MISINLFLHSNMLLSVLAMAQLTATGNPAIAADLLDVYDMAINSDPQYRQVAAAKQATLEQYPQALSQLLPSINLSANTRTNDQDISTQGFGEQGDIEFNSHDAGRWPSSGRRWSVLEGSQSGLFRIA